MEARVNKLEDDLEVANQSLDATKKELADMRQSKLETDRFVIDQDKIIKDLESKLSVKGKASDDSDLALLRKQYDDLVISKANSDKRISQLDDLLRKSDENLRKISETTVKVENIRISELESQLMKAKDDYTNYMNNCNVNNSTNEKRIADIEVQLMKARDDLAANVLVASTNKAAADKKVSDLENQLLKAKEFIATLQSEMAIVIADMPAARADMEQALTDKANADKTISDLMLAKVISDKQIAELEVQSQKDMKEVSRLRSELEKDKKIIQTSIEEIATLKSDLSSLKKQILELSTQPTVDNSDLEVRLKKAQLDLLESNKTNEELQTLLKNQLTEINLYKTNITQLTTINVTLEGRVAEVEGQIKKNLEDKAQEDADEVANLRAQLAAITKVCMCLNMLNLPFTYII